MIIKMKQEIPKSLPHKSLLLRPHQNANLKMEKKRILHPQSGKKHKTIIL